MAIGRHCQTGASGGRPVSFRVEVLFKGRGATAQHVDLTFSRVHPGSCSRPSAAWWLGRLEGKAEGQERRHSSSLIFFDGPIVVSAMIRPAPAFSSVKFSMHRAPLRKLSGRLSFSIVGPILVHRPGSGPDGRRQDALGCLRCQKVLYLRDGPGPLRGHSPTTAIPINPRIHMIRSRARSLVRMPTSLSASPAGPVCC